MNLKLKVLTFPNERKLLDKLINYVGDVLYHSDNEGFRLKIEQSIKKRFNLSHLVRQNGILEWRFSKQIITWTLIRNIV